MTERDGATQRRLERLTEAISNEIPIDWEKERADSPLVQRRMTRLRQLEALGRAHR